MEEYVVIVAKLESAGGFGEYDAIEEGIRSYLEKYKGVKLEVPFVRVTTQKPPVLG